MLLGAPEPLFIGTRDASNSANGQPFAVSDSVLEDLEEAGTIKVKVVRALTDWDSGATRLQISSETLTLASGDFSDNLSSITLTLGGKTLIFDEGSTPVSTNPSNSWFSYLNTGGPINTVYITSEVSATGAVYAYEDAENPALTGEFDTEAFFAFGFETDPDEIAVLVGTAIYSGDFAGYGQVIDPSTGDVILSEREFSGTITLTAEFGATTPDVSGDLDGNINYADGSFTDFTASFSAPIEGNGFAGSLDNMTCADAVCLSDSELAGAFYGTDALESSGLLGMNVRVIPDADDEYQFISGGGFTATRPSQP
ncbi:transferrin-binding protein-like solute binding protein [Silicimonas sp. MF1-12-2]|uniref:transferrin-binding protein-like solute binding protein n=1 Tax=Silicimonas sp. MF1-12-2 TaxID=3384793 RepID=UPI0039B391DD